MKFFGGALRQFIKSYSVTPRAFHPFFPQISYVIKKRV